MSTQIDERVVAMKFDARDFNNNVQSTMSLLDKFKEQLNFKGAQKGLEDITAASDKVRLTHLEEAAIAVEAKFSTMSIVAISAINKIVDSAMSAGTQLVKSLSLDQVTSGFSKYEEKVKAVQTIMNATGLSIDEVSEQLDRLAWFTDETSYSFTDMVSNIGKFTSNNIGLRESVTAMQGIANWAALSGQGVNEASRAMYNLSQAISVGAVKLIDWKSIENANMATSEFKQTVLDTAEALGVLKKQGDVYTDMAGKYEVSVTNFTEELSKGWFTSEVLMKTLAKYGEYSDAVFDRVQETGELCAEAMTHVSDNMMELGSKAFRAAQEAKTFTDAIDATKDAVSTGWMQTFEIIFGNYEQAKELWTELANTLYDIFAASGEARNALLESWAAIGGRTQLIDTVKKAYEALLSVVTPLKQALAEMFPEFTEVHLLNIIAAIKRLAMQMTLSEEAAYSLKVIFKALLIPIQLVIAALLIAGTAIYNFISAVARMTISFLELIATTNPIEDFFRNLFGDERYARLIAALSQIVHNLADAFTTVTKKVSEMFEKIKNSEKLQEIFKKLSDILEPIKETLLDALVDGAEALANLDFGNIERFASITLETIRSKLSGVSGILGGILKFIVGIGSTIKDYFTGVTELSAPVNYVTELQTAFKGLNTTIGDFKTAFTLESLLSGAGALTEKLTDVVGGLSGSLVTLVDRLNPAKILLFAFGTALTSAMLSLSKMFTAFTSVSKVADSAKSVLDATAGAIKNFGKPNTIGQIANALLLLAAAVVVLSLIDPVRLGTAVVALGGLAAILGLLTATLAAIEKFLKPEKLASLTASMTKISLTILILAGALAILSGIETEGLAGKVVAVLGIVTVLGVIMTVMTIFGKRDISKNAKMVVAFALSLLLIVNTLKQLQNFDGNQLIQSLGSLLTLMGLLALMSHAMGQIKFTAAVGVTVMIGNIMLLVTALKALNGIPIKEIINAIPTYIVAVGLLGLLMTATQRAGKNAAKAGVFVVALAGSMVILAEAIKTIGSLDTKTAVQGGTTVGILLGIFGALTLATSKIGDNTDKMAKALVMMSICVMLLSVCISYLGKLDLKAAVQGAAVVSALLLVFSLIMKMNSVVLKEGEKFKSGTAAMIAMAALLGTTAAALALLTLIPDQDRLITSAASIALVMAAMGVAVKLMENMKFTSAISTAVGLLALFTPLAIAFALLNGMEINDGLIEKSAAIGIIMLALAVSVEIMSTKMDAKIVKGAYAALFSFIPVLGVIAGILLWLDGIDPIGAMANALGLSMLLVAISAAVKLLPTEAHFKQMLGAYAALGEFAIILGEMALILYQMNGMDPVRSLANATALSELLLAIGVAIHLLPTDADAVKMSGALSAIALFGAFSLALAAALLIVSDMNPISALADATALAILLAAISVCVTFLPKEADARKMTGSLAAIGVLSLCCLALAESIKIIGEMNPLSAIADAVALSVLLVSLSAAALLISKITDFHLEAAVPAIVTMAVAFAALLGALYLLRGVDFDGIENSVHAFGAVGAALGEVIGQFVGHVISGIASGLPDIGNYISEFITNVSGIAEPLKKMDSAVLSGAANLAGAILLITASDVINGLASILGGGSFTSLGRELVEFGPLLAEFAESVSGISAVQFTAISMSIKALAEAYDYLNDGILDGISDIVFGENNLATFGEELAKFGPYFKEFAMSLQDIPKDALDATVAAAKCLAELEGSLPKHGGWAQTILGDSDLGTFGENIVTFGDAIVGYSNAITKDGGIDTAAIQNSVGAAKALSELEKGLRSHEGGLQFVFGDADLGQFGANIAAFGSGLVAYSNIITGKGGGNAVRGKGGANTSGGKLDVSAIEASVPVAKALAEIEKGLGVSNGKWQSIFGGKETFADFGANLEAFGSGLSSYYDEIKNVNFSKVSESSVIAGLFADIEGSLGQTGGAAAIFFGTDATLSNFGENLKTLGKGFKDYNDKIDGVDLAMLRSSVDSLQALVNVSKTMDGVNTQAMTNFGLALSSLAGVGISSFVDAFYQGEMQFVAAITDTMYLVGIDISGDDTVVMIGTNIVNTIYSGILQNESTLRTAGEDIVKYIAVAIDGKTEILKQKGMYIVSCIISGIASKKDDVTSNIQSIIVGALTSSATNSKIYDAAKTVGAYAIKGMVAGVNGEKSNLTTAIALASKSMIDTSKKVLNEHSPSVEFETIGMNVMKGLENGLEANQKSLNQTMRASTQGLIDEAKEYLEITDSGSKVMSEQIGVYLVKGIADGITTETSAEEAMAKKAENIVSAFKGALEGFSYESEMSQLQYDIWFNRYGSTADTEELLSKQDINWRNKLAAAGKDLATWQAQLTALEMKEYGPDTQWYKDTVNGILESEKSYGDLINEYLESMNTAAVENAVDDLNNRINRITQDSNRIDLEYQMWYNDYGKTATGMELADRQQSDMEAKLRYAGDIVATNEAIAELLLRKFGEDSQEYRDANDSLANSIIDYQNLVNEYIETVTPDRNIINELNENIKAYQDAAKESDKDYQIWYNQYGAKASEEELEAKQREKIEARLEAAGKEVATNQAILNYVMERYGEDSQEYMDANANLKDSIISYQELINEFLGLVNPATEQIEDIGAAYKTAAQKYNEIMGNTEWVNMMLDQGYTLEKLQEYADEMSGLNALHKPKKEEITYEEVYAKYIPNVEVDPESAKLAYDEIYSRFMGEKVEVDLDFDEGKDKPSYEDLWNEFLPSDIEVQIDAAGEVIQAATEKTTKKAASSGTKSGVSSGVKSGAASAASALATDSDLAASISDIGDIIGTPLEEELRQKIQKATGMSISKHDFSSILSDIDIKSLASSGEDIINGLVQGIWNKASDVQTSITDVANSVVGWFNTTLGIHSPSTEMIESAEYVIGGLILGLENGKTNLKAAMTEIADILINASTTNGEAMIEIGKIVANCITTDYTTTMYSYNDRFYQSGSLIADAIINGLLDGVTSRQAEAINAVVQLATEMYQAACMELGMSPGMNVAVSGMTLSGATGGGGTFKLFTDEERKQLDAMENLVAAGRISTEEYWSRRNALVGDRSVEMVPVVLDTSSATKKLEQIQATYSANIASSINSTMTSNQAGKAIQNGSNASANTGTTYNFYQTNNSPKALSRIDIYRDTRNLLSSAKGVD